MGGLRFRVLGPVEATRDGHLLPLAPGRLIDLLAALAVSPNEVMSPGVLAEMVWSARPPRHPQAALYSAVARLRQVIGVGVIETHPSGYLLRADADSLDLLRFRQILAASDQEQETGQVIELLTEAIGLWRGTPLENVDSPVLLAGAASSLTQLYLDSCEKWAGLCLETERQDVALPRLARLVSEHPSRERLAGQLMLGLYRSGRQADALAAFESVRQALREDLGIDPGQDLRDLHLKILRADPSLDPRPDPALTHSPQQPASSNWAADKAPHRLPADTRVFTGRQPELARLLELAEETDSGQGPGTVVISAIDGMAGIGKTALALHAAHMMAERFNDGQLFINLHGYTEGYPPRTADQVLQTFLRTLGVPPQQIPEDAEERAALYRERLAGTRTLIVLDNAADEAQVRPLIPGDSQCLVVVTSRRKLKALDDAHAMALDVLSGLEAIALLRTIAGPERVADDDPAVAEIADWCGRLPLAVRIAGALIRNRPAWTPGHLATKLRTARSTLDAFSDGDRDLAALFGLSVQTLNDRQRRLYRHLGLIPGPDADSYAAGALLDTDPATAERLLQDLVDHNLLQEITAGRYRMHDLVRAHARALAPPAPERDAVIARLFGYYEHTAGRADALIARHARPGPAGPPPAHAPALPDAASARTWLQAERANVTACLSTAIENGQDKRTVALSQGLASLLHKEGPWPQAIAAHTAAAAAAARLGDRSDQARALTELGRLQRLSSDYQGARASQQEALGLYQVMGDKTGQAFCLGELGSLRRVSTDYEGARASQQEALGLYRATGDKTGQAFCLTELGAVQYLAGDYLGGAGSLQESLALYREVGDKAGQAIVLTYLTDLQRITGDYESAASNGGVALAICKELGDGQGQANALYNLGRVHRVTGNHDAAARSLQAALDIYRELGHLLGQVNARVMLAEISGLAGEYSHAADELKEAIITYRGLGLRGNQAWALNYYGAVIAADGHPDQAITIYRDALSLAREVQHPDDEAIALQGIGENSRRAGRSQEAADFLRQALELYRRLGMPEAEHAAKHLAEIGMPW